jgi:hypothetical protein
MHPMDPNWPSDMSGVPHKVVATIRGFEITATREHRRNIPPDEPRDFPKEYWVVTLEGTRYGGWPADDPTETEAIVVARLEQWADRQMLPLSGKRHDWIPPGTEPAQ